MSKVIRASVLCIAAGLLWFNASAQATKLNVVSYSMKDGASQYGYNWYGYNDNSYNKPRSSEGYLSGGLGDLTDGVESASTVLGYYNWTPYVLWDRETPVITFDLGATKSVSSINTYFKYFPVAAVYMPDSVGIRVSNDGTTYTDLSTFVISADQRVVGGNDTNREFQVLSAPVTGRYFELTLNNQIDGRWIALGEVTFKGNVTPIPEPETYAMLVAGLGLIGAAVKRRKATQA
jgi:hypothetical protein